MRPFSSLQLFGVLIVFALGSFAVGRIWDGYFGELEGEAIVEARRSVERFDKEYREADPELLLLGNSILGAGVRQALMAKKTGLRTYKLEMRGSASATWYAYIKYGLIERGHRPQNLVIIFRDILMTFPTFRTDWRYQAIMKGYGAEDELLKELVFQPGTDPATDFMNEHWPVYRSRTPIRESVEHWSREGFLSTLLGTEEREIRVGMGRTFASHKFVRELATQEEEVAGIPNDFLTYLDFDKHVDASFLPSIIEMCEEAGIRLVLVRAPTRRDLPEQVAIKGLPEYAQELLPAYVSKLEAYLAEREVTYIDFQGDPAIKLEHFGIGDHMEPEVGRAHFTRLLAYRLIKAGVRKRE